MIGKAHKSNKDAMHQSDETGLCRMAIPGLNNNLH